MMHCQLRFPAKADMTSVGSLRQEWLTQMENNIHAQISCAGVEVMTAAAAQLVVSLGKTLGAVGGSVVLTQLSPALREDFILLGLTEFLQEPPHHA